MLSAAYVMNPAVRKLPYDPVTALVFVAKLGTSATLLCVGPSLPVSSVKEALATGALKRSALLPDLSEGLSRHHLITSDVNSSCGLMTSSEIGVKSRTGSYEIR